MNQPLVSIITVTYNAEKTLQKTIDSVQKQTYPNIEYIIIDGHSIDNTLNIIKSNQTVISHWISEPDNGIYDAMNKGLKYANGEVIAILNADDWYEVHAVETSIKYLLDTNSDYTYASILHHGERISKISPLSQESFPTQAFFQMPYPHISAFIKKEVYNTVGPFNTKYKIAGDHDMALKLIKAGYTGIDINNTIANALADGISSDFSANIESAKVALDNGRPILLVSFILMKQFIKYLGVKYLPYKVVRFLQKKKQSRFQ